MYSTAEGAFPVWLDHDLELVQAELACRFPGVPCWFGEYTGSWWAMLGNRLLEAASPSALADMIRTALAAHRFPPPPRPVPPPRRAPRARPVPRARTAARRRPPTRHAAARPPGGLFGRLRGRLGLAAAGR